MSFNYLDFMPTILLKKFINNTNKLPAAKSRSYAVATWQIVKNANNNPTADPSIHPLPNGSYNAELFKQLSPEMVLKMKALFPRA